MPGKKIVSLSIPQFLGFLGLFLPIQGMCCYRFVCSVSLEVKRKTAFLPEYGKRHCHSFLSFSNLFPRASSKDIHFNSTFAKKGRKKNELLACRFAWKKKNKKTVKEAEIKSAKL